MSDYLWDSYAIIALLDGAPSYSELRQAHIVTTPFAIIEACYILQRDLGYAPAESDELASNLLEYCRPIDARLLSIAATWRLKNCSRRRSFSYADAYGYVMALHLGLPFLTGDRAFEGLPGVELRR